MNLLALELGAIIGICVAAVLILAIIIWFIASYNKFVSLRAHVEDSFSTIDIYLKKRFDLIPNLVETVKGYAKHESETFRQVTEARAQMGKASTRAEIVEADKALSRALYSFRRVTENYPELKANTNFMDLQAQLRTIENELVNARKYYNACVRELNTKILSFPSLIVARLFKFTASELFEIAPEERENIKVSF